MWGFIWKVVAIMHDAHIGRIPSLRCCLVWKWLTSTTPLQPLTGNRFPYISNSRSGLKSFQELKMSNSGVVAFLIIHSSKYNLGSGLITIILTTSVAVMFCNTDKWGRFVTSTSSNYSACQIFLNHANQFPILAEDPCLSHKMFALDVSVDHLCDRPSHMQ